MLWFPSLCRPSMHKSVPAIPPLHGEGPNSPPLFATPFVPDPLKFNPAFTLAPLHPAYYPGAVNGYPGGNAASPASRGAVLMAKSYSNLLIHPALMGYPGLGPTVFKTG